MGLFKIRDKGFGLADVVFAIVILSTVVFGSLRLYADITRKKVDLARSQEAERLLVSLHEEHREKVFSQPLGPVALDPVTKSAGTYDVSMVLKSFESVPDDKLREVEYKARYEGRGVAKERTLVRRLERLD